MPHATIRTFFACEISRENLQRISKLLAELKTALPRPVKWVNSRNMHLTIKFIGEFDPTHLDKIETLMTSSLSSFQPFEMEIKGMGVFPSFSKPRVIWLGILAGNSLQQLVDIINQQCMQLGYPKENRPFSAHITLGRVKSYAEKDDLHTISDVVKKRETTIIGSQIVDSLHFIKSDLTPNGPIYKNLFTLPFSG